MRLFFMAFVAAVSLIFSVCGFLGKDFIIDNAYLKASEEERATMDRKAYRLQGATVFLLLFFASLCNLLRNLFRLSWLTYVGFGILGVGIVFFVISHFKLKKK